MADWSLLPDDALFLVLSLLPLSDLLRSAAVCRSWRSVQARTPRPPVLPWLLLSQPSAADTSPATDAALTFFSLSEQKPHRIRLPELLGKRFSVSAGEWLVALDDDRRASLVHPFSRARVPLPAFPPDCPCEGFTARRVLHKTIVSKDPVAGSGECLVMAVYGCRKDLAFCFLGDESWTEVGIDYCSDIICFDRWFCALKSDGAATVVWDVVGTSCKLTRYGRPLQLIWTLRSTRRYLVDAGGRELWQVVRYLHPHDDDDGGVHYLTTKFQAFRMDEGLGEWVGLKRLDSRALFLGSNSSIALRAREFPGCKENSVYFTDDGYNISREGRCWCGHENMGIYDYETGKIDPFSDSYDFDPSVSMPIWWFPFPFYQSKCEN